MGKRAPLVAKLRDRRCRHFGLTLIEALLSMMAILVLLALLLLALQQIDALTLAMSLTERAVP